MFYPGVAYIQVGPNNELISEYGGIIWWHYFFEIIYREIHLIPWCDLFQQSCFYFYLQGLILLMTTFPTNYGAWRPAIISGATILVPCGVGKSVNTGINQAPSINLCFYSVAHCSRSQDIDLFQFQLSYYYNPLQDTCPITSAVLGHLIRTHVPLIFLDQDKKSYRLSEKCATLLLLDKTLFCNLSVSSNGEMPIQIHTCNMYMDIL